MNDVESQYKQNLVECAYICELLKICAGLSVVKRFSTYCFAVKTQIFFCLN